MSAMFPVCNDKSAKWPDKTFEIRKKTVETAKKVHIYKKRDIISISQQKGNLVSFSLWFAEFSVSYDW